MKQVWSVMVAMVMVAALAAPAPAEEKKDRPGGVRVEATSITVTVEAIDYKTRKVTLKGPKGGEVTFIAGDEVKRLNDIKKGDQVTFDYTEGVAIDVQKSTEAPKMVETQSLKRAKPEEKPGGTLETVGFMTARVDEIDQKTRIVKLALPEGQTIKFTVGDQVKRLNEINKGDEVVVQYMQKLTIKVVTPKQK